MTRLNSCGKREGAVHYLARQFLGYVSRQFSGAQGFRMIATRFVVDLCLCNLAFFTGYLATIAWHAIQDPEYLRGPWMGRLLTSGWLVSVPLFTLCSFLAFVIGGMYRTNPRFNLRQKLTVSARSAALAYLLFIAVIYLTQPVKRDGFPSSALLVGLFLLFAFTGGIRAAKYWFTSAYILEPRTGPKPEQVRYVLVIGGAGYIGSTLVRRLLEHGYHVRVLDKLMFGDESVRELYTHPRFQLVEGDFRNIETVGRCVHGMDAVIHLGAIVGDPACALDSEFTLSVNTHAVRMIRDICSGYGVRRFVFASTCSVYGAQNELIDENSPVAPVSLYAQSKVEAERVLLEKVDGCNPTILRLATAYGLSKRMRFDLVVNLLTARAAAKRPITIFNKQQWRPFIHINDIARAFVACLEAPVEVVSRRIFNAGDNRENLTLGALGALIADLIPDTEVVHQENSTDPRSYRVDFSEIEQQLGFRCETTVREGVREMAAAILAGNFDSYEDVAYNNAAHLKSGAGSSRPGAHGVMWLPVRQKNGPLVENGTNGRSHGTTVGTGVATDTVTIRVDGPQGFAMVGLAAPETRRPG